MEELNECSGMGWIEVMMCLCDHVKFLLLQSDHHESPIPSNSSVCLNSHSFCFFGDAVTPLEALYLKLIYLTIQKFSIDHLRGPGAMMAFWTPDFPTSALIPRDTVAVKNVTQVEGHLSRWVPEEPTSSLVQQPLRKFILCAGLFDDDRTLSTYAYHVTPLLFELSARYTSLSVLQGLVRVLICDSAPESHEISLLRLEDVLTRFFSVHRSSWQVRVFSSSLNRSNCKTLSHVFALEDIYCLIDLSDPFAELEQLISLSSLKPKELSSPSTLHFFTLPFLPWPLMRLTQCADTLSEYFDFADVDHDQRLLRTREITKYTRCRFRLRSPDDDKDSTPVDFSSSSSGWITTQINLRPRLKQIQLHQICLGAFSLYKYGQ